MENIIQFLDDLQKLMAFDEDTSVEDLKANLDQGRDKINAFIKVLTSEDNYITIDSMGTVKIIGAIETKEKTGKPVITILTEDIGTLPMFEIRGTEAVWRGGLSSTAQARFIKAKEGKTFSYSRTVYRKLRMNEIKKLYNTDTIYAHSL